MPQKKTKSDAAAEKIADILIEHMEETMTQAQAKATLMELHTASASIRRRNKAVPAS